MSKAKYEQGERICSIAQFEASACKWFKWRGRTLHREFSRLYNIEQLKELLMAACFMKQNLNMWR